MKRLLILLSVFFSADFYSQNIYPYPNSIIDIGIGAGANYGIFGTKTVVGFKGNGLLVGLGMISGKFAYEIGVQGNAKWWFVNMGYGVTGTFSDYYEEEVSLVKSFIFQTGVKLSLVRSKVMFLELGIGFHGESKGTLPDRQIVTLEPGIMGSAGLGFRLGNVKKKENPPQ